MRKEIRKELVEKEVWVHEDGTEFDSEESCKLYEKRLQEIELEKRADRIPRFEFQDFLPYADHDITYLMAYIKEKEDLISIVKSFYIDGENEVYKNEIENANYHYPEWFVFTYDDTGYGCFETASELTHDFISWASFISKEMEKIMKETEK